MAASPGGVEVGRVSVRVLPDTSRFYSSLKGRLETIEKKIAKLDIKVEADTSTVAPEIEKTRKQQEKMPVKVPVKAGTDALFAQVKAEALKISKTIQADIPITADGERLRQEIAAQVALIENLSKVDIPVDLEDAAKLRTKMAVELDLLKLMAKRASPTVEVKTEIDNVSLARTEAELAGASFAANGLSGGLGNVASAAIVLGPALIPVIAAVAALGAALVAPLAVVGGGVTLFGFIAGFTIAETQKQLKAITAAQTKLDGLTKGTKEYAAAAADLKAKQAALTPAQVAFQEALATLKSAFDKIPKAIVLTPIIEGIKLLARVLPLATPILKVVSGVVSDVVKQFDGFAKSAGFKSFVSAFAKQLGPDLRAFASIAGNVFLGLFGLFGAFNRQLSGSVLKSLETLTAKFADWGKTIGQSQGFKSFVDYIKRVGPQVAKALGAITLAAVNIAVAFAPFGGVVLAAITALATAINKIPTDVLVGLATAFVSLVVASKFLGPVTKLLSLIGLSQPEIILVVAAVAALVVGFVALYRSSKPLQQTISDLGDFFKTKLLPYIRTAAAQILPALRSAFQDISKSIKDNKGLLEEFGKAILILGSAAIIAGIVQLIVTIRVLGKVIAGTITAFRLLADSILTQLRLVVDGLSLFLQGVLFVFGKIVDGAASAFGWLPGIGPKVRAAQAQFHTFADNVINDLAKTSAKLKALQDQIDGLHGKTLTITVIAKEQGLDRATGPGGGIGRPGQSNPDASSTRTGSSKSQVTINHATFTSTDDVLRKSQNVLRSRAGGGVVLAGGNR